MLDTVITRTAGLLRTAYLAAPTIPNPGDGSEPPFGHQIETLLKWAMWGALFCCVAGFIIIGARMGIQHKKGEGGSHMGSLAIVGFGCVLIVTAYAIVSNLAGAAGG
ncbi:hypothetical protein [Actinomadura montaniterrae]|uniref:Conjugal transfer protein TrbC n=1 Tax=Actinomadura montaniterrae TaxID=1803903 RepID=A0A6L3VXN9_9ACTN|nr:hypothetical protein [Actinomadura montaniterrae]KAB2385946.1 hypothetical protein F9B16_09095 [Actinomadura montaniterrae]